ncbi:glutathione S-transferase [Mycena crocata]|nr:glutathione S-transferase [Mycena crocata]
MVLKLYAAPRPTVLKVPGSPNIGGGTAIVALVLAEKQIPFEFIPVDVANKANTKPEFLVMQPFGEVPVIDDNGFMLYESRAICRYLAEKYAEQGPRLLPTDLRGKAVFEQAASVEFANFYPHVQKTAREALGKPARGLPVDQTVLAEAISGLSATLDVYDGILRKQRFLAGDDLTLVDLFHLAFATFLAPAGIEIMTTRSRPNVARWWNEIISRPAWVRLHEEGVSSGAE